jgi:hypothetical protein
MKKPFSLLALSMLAMLFCGQSRPQVQTHESKDLLVANVREFGAKGDGKTDDTAAIEAAWRVVCNVRKPEYHGKGSSPRWYAAVNEPMLYFPPGVYVYKGKGLEGTLDEEHGRRTAHLPRLLLR